MFCGKGCMLSRFTVVVCVSIAVVGGKLRFLSGRPRDLWHSIYSFCFLGANYYCNSFYDCNSFGSFCSWGWVSSCLVKSRWFRSWSWEPLLTRHYCSHCPVKNKGGCSFGLFKYDGYVSFRAIGLVGYLRSTAGLMFCWCGFPLTLACVNCWRTDTNKWL